MARDGRKRGYSQAFQLVMNAMPHRRAQVPRTMTASALSEASTPLEFDWCNKENEKPFEDNFYGPFLYNPGQVASSVLPQSEFHWPPNFTPLPLPQVKAQPDMPQPLQTLIQLPFKSIPGPQLPVGRRGFRPIMALGSSPDGEGDVLDLLNTEPGPAIFEDNITMSDDSWFGLPLTPSGLPLTPSELPMQDLSLGSDPVRPLPELPTRPVLPRNKTTVHIMPKSDWFNAFPNTPILDTDIILLFDKGRDAIKINIHTLCAASNFFSNILDFTFLPGPNIRILRLRHDFPYAIHALLTFIATGTYTIPPEMRIRFPTTNMFDLHVHAYLVGTKYGVPQLAQHAITQYIALGKMGLAMPFDHYLVSEDTNGFVSDDLVYLDPMFPPPHAGSAIVKAFLESIALVWNKTEDREDEMRKKVLEVVKHFFVKLVNVSLFELLMSEVVGFAGDLKESLLEDGVEMKTVWGFGRGIEGGVSFE